MWAFQRDQNKCFLLESDKQKLDLWEKIFFTCVGMLSIEQMRTPGPLNVFLSLFWSASYLVNWYKLQQKLWPED